MKDTLGDRRKSYEWQETSRRFMPDLPILARLGGKPFHTFTRGVIRNALNLSQNSGAH